ncbi:MAG TPA: hypothetical protein VMU31_11385 [Rhizomicrobium sp.]|nr:hypothetical protein [Rhizomicrobium sp.]
MVRFVPFLALGIALGFSAAVFLVVDPPPAFRLIRYDESMAQVFESRINGTDPCAIYSETDPKYKACRKSRLHLTGKPSVPELKPKPQYKMADPFWDRA